MSRLLNFVFEGTPGKEPRLIEIEDAATGTLVDLAQYWHPDDDDDGLWILAVRVSDRTLPPELREPEQQQNFVVQLPVPTDTVEFSITGSGILDETAEYWDGESEAEIGKVLQFDRSDQPAKRHPAAWVPTPREPKL